MTTLLRLLTLLLLALALAATADTGAPSTMPLNLLPAADWKAALCALLVVIHMARRRSRWLAD